MTTVEPGPAGGPAPTATAADVVEWFQRYAPSIRQFTLFRTGEPSAADDFTSETFLRAMSSLHSYRPGAAGVRPWLFTIARNLVHDYHRSACHRYEVPSDELPDVGEAVRTPEQLAIDGEAARDVAALLAELTPDQRECVRLRFFEQLSVREAAVAMGREECAVRTLQHRALRRLGRLLGRS